MADTHDYPTKKVKARDLDNTMTLVGASGGLSSIYEPGPYTKLAFGMLSIETEHGPLFLDPDEEQDVLDMEPQQRFPENVNPERCIVLVGDPVDGINTYGPFDNSDDASGWAEQFHGNETWWIVTPVAVQCDRHGNWIPEGE